MFLGHGGGGIGHSGGLGHGAGIGGGFSGSGASSGASTQTLSTGGKFSNANCNKIFLIEIKIF